MNYEDPEADRFQNELKRFVLVIKQEVLSPDILPFEEQLFAYLNRHVKQQQMQIKVYLKPQSNYNDTPAQTLNIRQQIYKCQTEKVGYLLKEYLRIRLRKIQKYCFYLYKNQNTTEKKLSQNEYIFMKGYAQMKYSYIQQNILKTVNLHKNYKYGGLGGLQTYFSKSSQIKPQIQTKQSKIDIPQPSPNAYVFCKITGNPDLYKFNTDIPVSNVTENSVINANSTIYGQYKYFVKLINEGNAELI